ncbi:MAG: hypothetical protein AAF938_09450 [Myxococcota bacterium]
MAVLTALFALTTAMDETGCESEDSANVVQSRVHQSYWLLYDAEQDVTYARAQFRLGNAVGTTLVLSDGATVAFDERAMGFNELLDWHETSFAGQLPSGQFVYDDLNESRFANVANLPGPVDVPTDFPAVLLRDGALELQWLGSPLGPGESLAVVIAQDANRFNFQRWETRERGATSIVLDAQRMGRLPLGGAVITLRRWFETTPDDTAEAGGVLRTTYQSEERFFELR